MERSDHDQVAGAVDAVGSPCVGCGLCCDGTVVSHLAVRDVSDLGAPLAALGVEVIVEADPAVFALPCPALVDGVCTVYDLHRPRACAEFECALSTAVLGGAVPLAEARGVVAEARRFQALPDDQGQAALIAHVQRHFLPG